jgi:hypothetical protein
MPVALTASCGDEVRDVKHFKADNWMYEVVLDLFTTVYYGDIVTS